MANAATRLITLIQLLQREPNQKAADLARELGVSVRTVHRYFAMLEEMGIPLYADRGPYGGFSLVRGYKLPPLMFTPEEAAALSLGAGLVSELWGSLYREAAAGASAKLENVLPESQLEAVAWARRSLVASGLVRTGLAAAAQKLEALRRAMRTLRQVELLYPGSGEAPPAERLFDPYALGNRAGWWYVVGFCHLRGALRTFRVDRILRLEVSDRPFDPPDDFDAKAYFARQAADQVRVRLRFFPNAAGVAHYNRSFRRPT
jgi:predicted DNA-binding transcriptional regulator YafY